MFGEARRELAVQFVRLAGVNSFALGVQHFVFTHHLYALPFEGERVAPFGGLHGVVVQREPPTQNIHRRYVAVLINLHGIQVARNPQRPFFQTHADHFHAVVGLQQRQAEV